MCINTTKDSPFGGLDWNESISIFPLQELLWREYLNDARSCKVQQAELCSYLYIRIYQISTQLGLLPNAMQLSHFSNLIRQL